MAKPSKRTKAVESAILDGLAEGRLMPEILKAPGMPAMRTVQDWEATDDEFRTLVARARKTGAIAIAAEGQRILDECDDSESSCVQKATSRANYRKWIATCFNRETFGDKQGVELSGPAGGPVQVESIVDLVRRVSQEDEAEKGGNA